MESDNFADRLLDFVIRIIKLGGSLPDEYLANHIKRQMLRSATSVGANYEEARDSESDADFLHKMNIVLKEARETHYWLKIINRTEILPTNRMTDILSEASEICAILVSSVKTLKDKKKKSGKTKS